MSMDASELAYRACALAQAHPLSPEAKRFVDRAVVDERARRPATGIAVWARAALTRGYCLRRVEEQQAGYLVGVSPVVEAHDLLADQTVAITADLFGGDAAPYMLGDPGVTFLALDLLVAWQVERRLGHGRDPVDRLAWAEMQEYIIAWAVKGYALRVAEGRQRAAA